MNEILLSVVATSRNDDHGGDMLGRMQHFVDGFIAQCRRHDLRAELILVEWNPPSDRPSLAKALSWPKDFGPAEVRIITVPRELHRAFENADKLPLFQMIGKNVGIRRARAPFVLATNVDILFNDKIFEYMRNGLKRGTLIRADRFDVPKGVPRNMNFDSVLDYCDHTFYHVNTRLGTYDASTGKILGRSDVLGRIFGAYYRVKLNSPEISFQGLPSLAVASAVTKSASIVAAELVKAIGFLIARLYPPRRIPMRAYRFIGSFGRLVLRLLHSALKITIGSALYLAGRWQPRTGQRSPKHDDFSAAMRLWKLHTFACGDFTLMAREDWYRLRGYVEWPIYSWHIDSVLMYAANALGVRQIVLNPSNRVYHIEQTPGSGWSPDAAEKLFCRLEMAGIPYMTDEQLRNFGHRFFADPESGIMNDDHWGLSGHELPEVRIAPGDESVIEGEKAAKLPRHTASTV